MNSTVAIVVTYNRKELLKQNIEHLLMQTEKSLDILIIDNASTDGTNQFIQQYADDKRVNYYNTGKNLGGAGGFHYGVKQAVLLGYEYLWIMDDDCFPNEDALEKLLLADKELKGNYGFLSSKVIWTDGTICKMNVQKQSLTKKVSNFEEDFIPVTFASFVSLFMRSKVVKELGLPIEEFFIWSDDWEYTRRISLRYKCYVVSNSIVLHASKNNLGANIATDQESRLGRYNYLYRNDVYMYRREGVKGFFYELTRVLCHAARVMCLSKTLKWNRMKIIFCGTISGFSFNPKIEYIDPKKSTRNV